MIFERKLSRFRRRKKNFTSSKHSVAEVGQLVSRRDHGEKSWQRMLQLFSQGKEQHC
jgi:hypothetical protein